uniref:hypothetical protein n=1 Tax=Nocardia neocaledoniensis TaxID=236511 RepID=UPI002454DB9B
PGPDVRLLPRLWGRPYLVAGFLPLAVLLLGLVFSLVYPRWRADGDLPLQDRVGVHRDLQGGGNVTFHRHSLTGERDRGDSNTQRAHLAAEALPARDRNEARVRDR